MVAAGVLSLAGALCDAIVVQPVHAQAAVDGFVTRSGATLSAGGATFRFAGANAYWLGLDEQSSKETTAFRVDDLFSTAAEMGLTVVRSFTLGTSVGCPECIEPERGVYDELAFRQVDYAIKSAHDHGLRLIITLTDNYHYYYGGKHTFTDWRNLPEDQFFTDPTVISDFESYVDHILTRVNSITGVAYRDDPTIMAWETGNEIGPPSSWTDAISTYIKSVDPNHLVMDGSYGINTSSLALPNVDIYSDHYYPMSVARLTGDAQTAANASKAFVAGEYGWSSTTGDSLASFLTALESSQTAGDLFWGLFAHDDGHGYEQHGDGYTLHYPGDTPAMRTDAAAIRQHAFRYAMELTDDLNDWSLSTSHTQNLQFDTTNASLMNGDGSRASRTTATNEEIVWRLTGGVSAFSATTYFWPNEPVSHFSFFISSDGSNWQPATPAITGGTGNWIQYQYSLTGLQGVSHVKMRWNNLSGMSWSPQIGQVTMSRSAGAQPVDSVPAQPLLTEIAANSLAWRGTAAAASYWVDRSTAGASGPWTTICAGCVTDDGTPWTDADQPVGPVWYRVAGVNLSGVRGTYSAACQSPCAAPPDPPSALSTA